jgi:hypothetical protein
MAMTGSGVGEVISRIYIQQMPKINRSAKFPASRRLGRSIARFLRAHDSCLRMEQTIASQI